MAINMTIDGITKEVTKLNLVGADGTTKTATLTETSESSSGTEISMEGISNYHRAEHQAEVNSSYATPYQIDYNAGFIPDLIVLRRITSDTSNANVGLTEFFYRVSDGNNKAIAKKADTPDFLNVTLTSISVDGTKIMYQPSTNDYRLYAGSTYEILCFKFENSLA